MKAQLIGESSAGMTAVHIYDNDDNLVWSHRWFDDGASHGGYISGLKDAFECMLNCDYYLDFDGCVYDDDGYATDYDDADTTGVVIEYDSETKKWSYGDYPEMGEGREIVDACILAGLLPPDDHHNEYYNQSDVVDAIVAHITNCEEV